MPNLAQEPTIPFNEKTAPLSEAEVKELWFETPMWNTVEMDGVQRLQRTFELDSFAEAVSFANAVGILVQDQEYLPTILIEGKTVTVDWCTWRTHGLHQNDFIMAARTDENYLKWLDSKRSKDPVTEASKQSFPASDAPGWIGQSQEEKIETP